MEVSGKRLETSWAFCEPCKTEKVSKQADGFCTDCKESMCQTCFLHHLKAKSCRNHVLDPYKTIPSESNLQTRERKCEKHSAEIIKYYCNNHNSVACGDCLVLDHPKCEPTFIRDLAKNFKESFEFKSLLSRMEKWEADKAESETRVKSNREQNKVMFDTALQELKNFRNTINDWMDKTEESIETEIREISDDNDALLSEMEEKITVVSADVDKIKRNMDTNLYMAEDLFIHMLECKERIDFIDTTLSDIKTSNFINAYTFEPEVKTDEMTELSVKVGVFILGNMLEEEDNQTTLAQPPRTHDSQKHEHAVLPTEIDSDTDIQQLRTPTAYCDDEHIYVNLTDLPERNPDKAEMPPLIDLRLEPLTTMKLATTSLKLTTKLCSTSFGEVLAGKVDVAVKTLKPGRMTDDAFFAEANILHQLRHNKILHLLAVCTQSKPKVIITELMVNGNLLDYLRNDGGKHLRFPELTHIAGQIADGMAYLEIIKYVHRDLRAANILVGENNEVKITGFRLANHIQGDVYVTNEEKVFLLKWTAPEAVFRKQFSIKSDVWSYGVLLYELITYGQEPYPGMKGDEVLNRVEKGFIIPKPTCGPVTCTEPYYEIMVKCWNRTADSRPTFDYLHSFFENYTVETEGKYDTINDCSQ